MGKNKDDCYLVVFPHKNSQSNGIILGNVVLQKYYTVFDATPYDERNQNFIQIGIANSATTDKVRTQFMIENDAKRNAWEKKKQAEKELEDAEKSIEQKEEQEEKDEAETEKDE